MLILSCKVGEQIVLPGLAATIAVVAVKGKAVRLGVSAPAQIAVHRKEVWRQLERAATVGNMKDEG